MRAILDPIRIERNTAQMVYANSKKVVDLDNALAVQVDQVSTNVEAVETEVAAHAATLDDHETRIAALEGP